jgi:uncharacterized protein (TIGR00251 family)
MRINVLVTTNSKHSEVVRIDEGNYRVRIDAPAVEGKANKRLIEIISEHFNVPKSSIKILRGLKNRNKTINIDNL